MLKVPRVLMRILRIIHLRIGQDIMVVAVPLIPPIKDLPTSTKLW